MKRYLLAKHISLYQTAAEWLAHVKSLYIDDGIQPDSHLVPDFRITDHGSKVTIKCHRIERKLTDTEVIKLCEEYKMDQALLRELLTKRKFLIVNEAGEQTNVRPKKQRKPRVTKPKATKENVNRKSRERKDSGGAELLQPRATTDVPQEESLLTQPTP